jgi:hypothetical protein
MSEQGHVTPWSVHWPLACQRPEGTITTSQDKAVSTGTIVLQKHEHIPFPCKKRYLRRSGWCRTVQGSRHTWTLKKNVVPNIVSFLPLNYSPSVLTVLVVVVLVVVLLSCCFCCLCLLCCRIANTAASATISMPLPPPTLPVSMEVDICYKNADSSPATALHTLSWAPTKGWWQRKRSSGGDPVLGYNKGVECYPSIWGVKLLGYSVNN